MHSLCSLCIVHASHSKLSRFSALRAGVAVSKFQQTLWSCSITHWVCCLCPLQQTLDCCKDTIPVPTVLSATALSMVEPSQRWLLNPAPLLQSLRAPQPFITPHTPSPDPSTTALSRCKPGIAHSIVVLSGDSSQALGSKCQYTDLTREHAAAHAHALLARLQPDAKQKPTVPDDVFQQALALGKHSCCLLYCRY